MSYDPDARRDTPLALTLKQRIKREGPISVAAFMQACLHDAEHGYYRKMPAIGAGGDFVTAPEISQVFGELIGSWCAVVWRQMGSPGSFNLIEYGPGRGTMMADALRALQRVPACLEAAQIRLVETDVVLRQAQQATLRDRSARLTWHTTIGQDVEPLPSVILANEVLDTQAVEQSLSEGGSGIWTRGVGLDDAGRLVFEALDRPGRGQPPLAAEIIEARQLHPIVDIDMRAMPVAAALFIDYGHVETRPGDTLQAVRQHHKEHALTSPGEADLTAQVDFQRFSCLCREAGLRVDGPVTQTEFLGQLGIVERASRLMAANPAKAAAIEAGVARLIAPQAMGSRFKAIGVRSAALPALPGFPIPE